MSIFDDNKFIEISRDDINDAAYSTTKVEERIKNRVFANVLGARLGIKYLNSLGINASNETSLYTIPAVLKDMDISDILVEDNNIKIDIRIVPNEDTLFVPKEQYTFNTIPDIYIFIELANDFSTAAFLGAIAPDEIDTNKQNENYYFVSKDDLYNEKSLKEALKKRKPGSNLAYEEADDIRAQATIVNFIDGDILHKDKLFLYEQLGRSPYLRNMLKDFGSFEYISTDLAHTEELLSDSVLDILGAQQMYKEDLSDGNFDTNINLDELADSTVADFVEDFNDFSEDQFDIIEDNSDEVIDGEFTEIADENNIYDEPGALEELPSDEDLANFSTDNEELTNLTDSVNSEFEILQDESTDGFEGFEGLEENNIDSLDFEALPPVNLDNSTQDDGLMSGFEEVMDEVNIEQNTNDLEFTEVTDNTDTSEFTEFETLQPLDLTNSEDELSNLNAVDEVEDFQDFEQFETPTENAQEINIENSLDEDFSDFEILSEDNESSIDTTSQEEFNNFEETEDLTENIADLENTDFSEINDNNEFEILQDNNFDTVENLENNDFIEDISNVENQESINDIEAFDDLTTDSIENFESIENLEPLEELQEISNDSDEMFTDISEDFNMNDNQNPSSLLESVQNEGMEINTDFDMTDIDTLDAPMSLELPNLEADSELETLEEINPDSDTILSLDDIAESVNFSEPEIETTEDNSFEEISSDNIELLEDDNFAEINSEFDTSDLAPLQTTEDIDLSEFEITDTQPESSLSIDTSSDDDDMSGLEEFTMDMAHAIEESNPNLNNPQVPTSDSPVDEFAAFANNVESLNEDFSNFEYNDADTQINNDVDLDNININNIDIDNLNVDDINLDDLDGDEEEEFNMNDTPTKNQEDYNIDDMDIDAEINNLVNSDDIDLSSINLDDIDLNDPSLNIDDISLDYNEDIQMGSDINNIPDISQDYNAGYEQQYQPQDVVYNQEADMNMMPQNEYMQQESNYNPDYAANDQNTIETLYENNQQNYAPGSGDAMDNSFAENNVNPQQEIPSYTNKKSKGKKTTSPLLGILLIVLIIAFGYMKKDLIMEKFNMAKGVQQVQQDQNMPIEGETKQDEEDAALLNDQTPADGENEENKQPIGEIPGEAGGPQDVKSMQESLNQGMNKVESMPSLPSAEKTSTPQPIASNSVRNLYWEIPQDLTYNDAIVKFLKVSGRTMKFAIQSDLLNATELPYSSKMIVDVTINKSGDVVDARPSVSSGSKQIDTIVLQSVKATLKYVKAPTAEFKAENYTFALIINF